ncbi:MAG: NADH-quinone oxidoreductase subunit J [Cyclobacteriaceae bacterium]
MIDWLFLIFGMMTIIPVLYLIFSKDVVRSAFAFVITLLGLSAFYVLLNAELMAIVQILIYAGGMIVLIIFGIMLTKRTTSEGVMTGHRNVWIAGAIGLLSFGLLSKWILESGLTFSIAESIEVDQVSTIGVLFLTDHIIAFEVVAILLLVALVGATYLAKKSSEQ